MKVAITTVGSKRPEDESKNEGRLKAGKLAMAKAKSTKALPLALVKWSGSLVRPPISVFCFMALLTSSQHETS